MSQSEATPGLRPVTVELGFHQYAEGSALYTCGKTRVLATASISDGVPRFLEGKGRGWLTADYQMHPRANPQRREGRDGRKGSISGRSKEIERLIGRSLRAAVDFEKLGERTIHLDCDILEADGGTRTASITAGFLALAQAVSVLIDRGSVPRGFLQSTVAAISVGLVKEELVLDLCYVQDSVARMDMNVVATGKGDIVEIQGTAEGLPIPRATADALIDLGLEGIAELSALQEKVLSDAGIPLSKILAPGKA